MRWLFVFAGSGVGRRRAHSDVNHASNPSPSITHASNPNPSVNRASPNHGPSNHSPSDLGPGTEIVPRAGFEEALPTGTAVSFFFFFLSLLVSLRCPFVLTTSHFPLFLVRFPSYFFFLFINTSSLVALIYIQCRTTTIRKSG